MIKAEFWIIMVVALMVWASSMAFATTTVWLSTDTAGTPITGNTISVPKGQTVKLYAFLESDVVGNVFELMIGYDASNATTYGAGKGTNNGTYKKLALVSTSAEIVATIPASYDVFSTAGYASSQVLLDASGREVANTVLGGRPYGFLVRAAKRVSELPGGPANNRVMCCSFTLHNNMVTPGDNQYVVLSKSAGANSFCDAWKLGVNCSECEYALNVVCGQAEQTNAYGITARSLRDQVMATAVSKYVWVLWGIATRIDADTFSINDGSGVIVEVNKAAHGLFSGDHVSVRGTLDLSNNTPILTAESVSKHN